MSVKVHGKKFKQAKVNGFISLDLSRSDITNISEIEGLDSLSHLQVLNLNGNKITEIDGLPSTLVDLRRLFLANNQITEIAGLDAFPSLRGLRLGGNQIGEIKGLDKLVNLRALGCSTIKSRTSRGLKSLETCRYWHYHEIRLLKSRDWTILVI
ncbi:MAG TPA: leucine-rich repeat domain-containing protein [Candidatus Lokiarchaeia archaeon]|nr:leucine-rich repeat domain-containing protein [Candidatus Lokiarchaeia archaeon]